LSPAYLHAHRFAAKRVPGDGHILAAPVRVNRGLPGTVRSTASDGEDAGNAPILTVQGLRRAGGEHVPVVPGRAAAHRDHLASASDRDPVLQRGERRVEPEHTV